MVRVEQMLRIYFTQGAPCLLRGNINLIYNLLIIYAHTKKIEWYHNSYGGTPLYEADSLGNHLGLWCNATGMHNCWCSNANFSKNVSAKRPPSNYTGEWLRKAWQVFCVTSNLSKLFLMLLFLEQVTKQFSLWNGMPKSKSCKLLYTICCTCKKI